MRLPAAVDAAVGLYGTCPTCHLSALARVDRYRPEHLVRAIESDRSMVRVRAMRKSVYLFGREQLVIALAATGRELLRAYEASAKRLEIDYDAAAARVEELLSRGPRPAAELRARIDPRHEMGWRFSVLLARMRAQWRLVRATTTGGWRSNRLTYALWQDWLPDVDPAALEETEAKRSLASAYVAAYGPVTLEDLAWWAGWSKRDARAVAAQVDLSARGTEIKRLSAVRLLPVWDVLMVAYRQRDRLLDPAHAPFVYDRLGNATSVVLDGGRVVGIWDLGKQDEPLSVQVAPLQPWPQRRWRGVERQIERIGAMIGATSTEMRRRERPVNLHQAARNRFLSPLAEP